MERALFDSRVTHVADLVSAPAFEIYTLLRASNPEKDAQAVPLARGHFPVFKEAQEEILAGVLEIADELRSAVLGSAEEATLRYQQAVFTELQNTLLWGLVGMTPRRRIYVRASIPISAVFATGTLRAS